MPHPPQESGGALWGELVPSLPHCPRQLHREQRGGGGGRRPAPGLRSPWEELKPGFCQSVGPHLVPPRVLPFPPAHWVFQRRRVVSFVLSAQALLLPSPQSTLSFLFSTADAVNPRMPLDPGAQWGRGSLPPGAACRWGAGHTAWVLCEHRVW